MLDNLLPETSSDNQSLPPLPPTPKVSKSIFELPAYNHITLLEEPLKWIYQYGDILKHPTLDDTFMVANPSAIERITKTNMENYDNSTILFQRMKYFFGDSLLVSSGDTWKQKRKYVQKSFQATCYQRYADIMQKHIHSHISRWESLAKSGQSVNLHDENTLITTRIAIEAFIGEDLSLKELKKIDKAIQFCHQHICFALFMNLDIPTWNNILFSKHNHFLDKLLQGYIDKRIEFPKPVEDLLNILIEAKNQQHDYEYTTRDAIDDLKTILATGQETTACSLSWTWYLLNQHPIYHQLLKEELDGVLDGQMPTVNDLNKLPYLKSIIQESMRLYPPIPMIGRVSIAQDRLGHFRIPKNSHVIINIHATHRNPEYWDNPNIFDPDRFLDFRHTYQTRYNYLPFLPGNKTCVAGHFAMLEMQLVLGALVARFKPQFHRKKVVHPMPMISLRPAEKMPVTIQSVG